MKKEKVKKVKVGDQFVEVTPSTPEIYHITFVYAHDIVRKEFYRSFRDEYDMYRYCYEIYKRDVDCIHFFWELIDEVDFNKLMEE